MKHKSKINLSVILLIIGIGLIPTAYFIKTYVTDHVSSEISPFLVDLESQMVGTIEDDYLGLGIYNVLPAIHDAEFTSLEQNYALMYGLSPTLKYLKNSTIEYIPYYINGSRAAINIRETIYQVRELNTTEADRLGLTAIIFSNDVFFNNYTFQDDLSTPIEGVSERMLGTESLNYSIDTIDYILNGRDINETSYLGLFDITAYGVGLWNFLELYDNAEQEIGNNKTLIQELYNCTWSSGQLQNLSAYIKTYLFDIIVKATYAPKELEDFAKEVFYDQWANASWILDGFNLRFVNEYVSQNLFGLEVGRSDPTNISIYSTINLWDPLNSSAFINNTGVYKWWDAYHGNLTIKDELMYKFQLDLASINSILNWLFNIVRFRFVPLFYALPEPIGIGMSMSEYTELIYLQQWANATHIPEGIGVDYFQSGVIRPNGDNETLWSYPARGNHYENIDDKVQKPKVGTPDHIATEEFDAGLTETFDMETISMPSQARVYKIDIWTYGYSDYGLNNMTVDINMNVWQGAQNVSMTNTSAWYSNTFLIDDANGTVTSLDALQVRFTAASNIDFFHSQYISTMYALVYYKIEVRGFEVGIPVASNIPLDIARDLLDPLNTSSFIDRNGILKWIDAYDGDLTAQSEIMAKFNLGLPELNLINNWLFTTFRYDIVPLIASDYTKIKMEDYARFEFYRQWSDGILYNNGLNLSSFYTFEPFSGWELGIPIESHINESVAERLWSDTKTGEPYSFTNYKGMSIWYKARQSETYYNFLKNMFELNTVQMDQILEWLITIKEDYVVPSIQVLEGMPTDPYTYANTLFLVYFVVGVVVMGIGALGLVTLWIIKRR